MSISFKELDRRLTLVEEWTGEVPAKFLVSQEEFDQYVDLLMKFHQIPPKERKEKKKEYTINKIGFKGILFKIKDAPTIIKDPLYHGGQFL